MRHIATMMMVAAIAMAASGPAAAGWNKFWENVKHGNNAFKESWNNSKLKRDLSGLGKSGCWSEAAKVGFTAGAHNPDTENCN